MLQSTYSFEFDLLVREEMSSIELLNIFNDLVLELIRETTVLFFNYNFLRLN